MKPKANSWPINCGPGPKISRRPDPTTRAQLRSTPVDVMQDGESPLAGRPYGEVNWVRNLRADDGKLTLRRGSHSQHYQQPLCAAVCANAHGRT